MRLALRLSPTRACRPQRASALLPVHPSSGKPLLANAPPTAGGGAGSCSFRRRMAGRRVALPRASVRARTGAAASRVSPSSPAPVRGLLGRRQGMMGREAFRVGEGDAWNPCRAGARASFLAIGPRSGGACHSRAWAGPRGRLTFSLAEGGLRLLGRVSSRRLRAALLPPCGAWPGSDARLWPAAALPPLPFTLSVPVGGRGHRTRREVAAASNARETPLGRHHGARGTLGRVREPEEGEAKGALRLGRASLGLRWPGRGGERSLKGTTCQDPARASEGRLPLAGLGPLRSRAPSPAPHAPTWRRTDLGFGPASWHLSPTSAFAPGSLPRDGQT